MNVKDYVQLWLVSIALSVMFIAGVVLYLPDPVDGIDYTESTEESISSSSVFVIGSSLMHSAVPGYGKGILGDERAHIRLAISSITEEQSLRLLEKVLLRPNTEVIFLEANPFVFDFANRRSEKSFGLSSVLSIAVALRQGSLFISSKIKGILFAKNFIITTEDRLQRISFQVKPGESNHYPLHLRSPKRLETLRLLVKRAKAQDMQVVLVATPRSQWTARYIGKAGAKQLERHYQKLAEQLNLPLFQTATFWPNENFRDSAHVNAIGRQRFLQELAAWWKLRP